MRSKFKHVIHKPHDLAGWWIDLPFRTRPWWREALFAPGEGWLKWDMDWRVDYCYDPPSYDEWEVYPPLRRAWFAVRQILVVPNLMLNEGFSWEEARPWFGCLRADEERKKELWR